MDAGPIVRSAVQGPDARHEFLVPNMGIRDRRQRRRVPSESLRQEQGPIEGALVEIEFSPEATALLAWSDPIPQYADIPTQYNPGRIYSKTTRAGGSARFWIAGGGCIRSEDLPDVDLIVQIRADGVVLGEREVNSLDVVDL
jgi:hypothetical protein